MIYLHPINVPITAYATIYKVFDIILSRPKQAELLHTQTILLTLVLLLMHTKSYGITPERFKNIIIHLGEIHFMKEVFNVLGSIVSSSSFEDIIFQANTCSTGRLNGALAASHYNGCWAVHSNIAEVLE